jgi:trans-aconitate 2-methyltransferase
MAHEFNGKEYEKASAHQKEWGARIIAELELKGTERVLDLGCGDGALTARLAELVPRGQVVGIDASRGMIETAREKERDNLHFLLKDIYNLDFSDEFDLVFSNAALHWVKDHGRLLVNVRRALRDGGKVRFNFAAAGNCVSFVTVVREAMADARFSGYFSGFDWPWYMPSEQEYEALARKSGFGKTRVWGENADRFFPDVATMIKWVDQPSLAPFLRVVADADGKAFRDYVVERMVEETRQDDGTCFETFRRINVLAEKF